MKKRSTAKDSVRSSKKRYGVSIGWKLGVNFLAFVAVVLIVVGSFQVLMLDFFFEFAKKRELETTATELSEYVGRPYLEKKTLSVALERNINILIYRVEEKELVNVANANNVRDDFREILPDDQLIIGLAEKAAQSEGMYQTKITFGGHEVQKDQKDIFRFQEETRRYSKIPAKNIRLVQVMLTNDEAGNTYILFLHTALLPLNSTVSTLKIQFSWIALILLVVALFMVFMLYRRISKPLIRMNASAKQLATGKYDVPFEGTGYRETRELAETLNYASQELSKLDRLQKELIANISHDLRTPLTMIRGYSEMMRDIPEENTPENMQLIIDETERLSGLVNDLLDLSRMQAGFRAPCFETFDLSEAMNEVMARYEAFVKHEGYRIEWQIEEGILVCADRSMILQVLYNFINNSIHYTGADKSVCVSLHASNGVVRASFTDTGAGIPKDQVELIWDRYYKIDKVHRIASVGTGLGLSIVKEILEKHQAVYGVNTTLGEGSTFWFELPIEASQPSTAIKEPNEEE